MARRGGKLFISNLYWSMRYLSDIEYCSESKYGIIALNFEHTESF